MSTDEGAFVLWDGRIDLHARVENEFPTWDWRCAPAGLFTRRQLRELHLRPNGQDPYGRIECRRGRRYAWLYRHDLAAPSRPVTPAMQHGLDQAMRARRICPKCKRDAGYCIPYIALGRCVECHLDEQENTPTSSTRSQLVAA